MDTDRCYYRVFQSAPDLIRALLPGSGSPPADLGLDPLQIMVIAGIPREDIRHTRAVQDWLAEGRQEGRLEGRPEGEAAVTLRQLNRRCVPLSDVTTARIQALPVEQLEALADALLDFQGPADLQDWLTANT